MNYRIINRFAIYALITGIFLTTVSHVHALTIRRDDHVTVSAGEVVSDSLFATGQTIIIEGVVEGDLYCGAQTLMVRGQVAGDVICGVQSVEVTGTVSGNLRVVAQTVDIGGTIVRNASVMAQTVQIKPSGVVTGELLVAAQRLDQAGKVDGNVQAGVQEARLAGQIGKNVELTVERLELTETASIAGNLTYTSARSASVLHESAVAGRITRRDHPEKPDTSHWQAMQERWQPVRLTLSVLMYGFAALALMRWFPTYTHTTVTIMEKQPVLSLMWGILIVFIVPVIGILLFLTLVGIPLALLLGLVVALVIFLGRVVTVLFLGKKLVELLQVKTDNLLIIVLLGTVGLWLLFSLPAIGGIASILVLLWSSGALLRTSTTRKKAQGVPSEEPTVVKATTGRKIRTR